MKKRTIAIVLLLSVFCSSLFAVPAKAEELTLAAPSAVLMEAGSGQVLFEKNSGERRACASITKVMTLLLTMEAIEAGTLAFTDTLTASAHAASMGGSDIWLKEGESMTVEDLVKATVIMSANDAAVVLAEAVAGSEEAFVERMNQRAAALGMGNTEFKNCNGLDEAGHLTTAYDVALMSRALLKHKKIFTFTQTWIDSLREGQTQLVNTNKLIKTYQGITGLKTGTTSQAGSCIAATAQRGELGLISVVLGCSSTDERFKDAAALLNYGFAKWTVVSPALPELERVVVQGGMADTVGITLSGGSSVLAELTAKSKVKCNIKQNKGVIAPVQIGQKMGVVQVVVGDTVLKEIPILATEAVEEITFVRALGYLFRQFSF